MLFRLKNVKATYQCLMNKIFEEIIGTDVEVYVDDMVVKSTMTTDHYKALQKAFQVLRRHQLKLNPEKCSFWSPSRKTPRIHSKDGQGGIKLAALSRFLSWSIETAVPIFNTLKKGDTFAWIAESEEAFLRLKAFRGSRERSDSPREGGETTPSILHKQDAERRYQRIEKAALTFIIASRRLRSYFQGYPVIIRTDLPIK
ncbi:Retrovirus-related Pol polyprotein from transposon 17.6, partial [Mucuna pruriens]